MSVWKSLKILPRSLLYSAKTYNVSKEITCHDKISAKDHCFIANKYVFEALIISNVTDGKKRTLKNVRLTGLQ